MDIIKKQWMDVAIELVEEAFAGEKVSTASQLRLVSAVAHKLESVWNQGYDAALEDHEIIEVDVDEVDPTDAPDAEGMGDGPIFSAGTKVRAKHDTWDGYGEYRIVKVVKNEHSKAVIYTFENVEFPEDGQFEVCEGDLEWHIEDAS